MGELRFSDGMSFDTSGTLRIERRSDGLYVVGEGLMFAVSSLEEGEREIARRVRTTLRTLKTMVKDYNGTFSCVDTVDHDGEKSRSGQVLVFLWDDEDDSDDFLEALPDDVRVERVTHDHNSKGILESRIVLERALKG